MTSDPRKFLGDMKLAAEFVVNTLADRTFEEFEQDLVLRYAAERELITLGEALSQLHRVSPGTAERMGQWQDIISFRNILVHGYDSLDVETVWDITQRHVPRLVTEIETLLS